MEGNEIKLVNLLEIDLENIEKDNSFPAAYAFYLLLDRTPDPKWVEFFNAEFEGDPYVMKRTVTVKGNRLRVVTADSDDLQGHVDFVKRMVNEANRRAAEYNQKLSWERRREELRLEEERRTVEELRRRLLKVRLD
ncbi:MAG TPA: hypothetical protein GXX51_05665 [Firmicutes bacterium]|nr:hypothetical protein [Bacillota bacterium]